MIKKIIFLVILLTATVASPTFAIERNVVDNAIAKQTDMEVAVQQLKKEWAEVKYLVPKEQKVKKLESLIARAHRISAQNPNEALPLLWEGTMLSTLASLKSGFGALGVAKKARAQLEESLMKDPTVENGYAHVILGALYSRVPGRPIGFGNKEAAKHHFLTALNMDPEGLESNFFYGEFLQSEGEYQQAMHHFEMAHHSSPNPNFKVFEDGRRQEVSNAMNVVNRKLS